MNQTDLNKYKAMLEARQAALSAGIRNRDDIAIEKTPDALDEVQRAGEREMAVRSLDRESLQLREVRAALGRIANGDYGICRHCEEGIRPKRLDAVPWAKYCTPCQEAVDRHEFEEVGDGNEGGADYSPAIVLHGHVSTLHTVSGAKPSAGPETQLKASVRGATHSAPRRSIFDEIGGAGKVRHIGFFPDSQQ